MGGRDFLRFTLCRFINASHRGLQGSEQMTLRFNLRLGHEVAVEVNDVMSDFGIVHITGAVVAIFPVWWSDVATKVRDRSDATPDSAWGTFRYRNQGAEAYGGYGWSAISG